MCEGQEEQYADKCKRSFKTLDKNDLKKICCNSFAIEKCILKQVSEDCKPYFRERFQNGPLMKLRCKQYVDRCDDIISSTTLQTSTVFNAKPENLKQSISIINPQIQTTHSDSKLLAEEQKNNGVWAARNGLLMVTCSSLVMVNYLLSRWLN